MISTDGSGVSSVQPSTQAYYVSNYLPLWTGIVAQEPQIASAVLDSFLSSGEALARKGSRHALWPDCKEPASKGRQCSTRASGARAA